MAPRAGAQGRYRRSASDGRDGAHVHPQLIKYCRVHATFADVWNALEACYEGSPEIKAVGQVMGRNAFLHVQRDDALRHLRELVREVYPSIAWAI